MAKSIEAASAAIFFKTGFKLDGINKIQLVVLLLFLDDIMKLESTNFQNGCEKMRILIDKDNQIPIYLQIKNQIGNMIISGELAEGFQLPPERKLAEMLGVNRSTVMNAYRELKADGYIDSHIGKGTVVARYKSTDSIGSGYPGSIQWQQLFCEKALRIKEPLVRDIMELASTEEVISFAAGTSAADLFPVEELQNLLDGVIKKYGCLPLSFAPTEGCYPLRESICRILNRRHIRAVEEEVLVLSGSQQGLDIAARAFIDHGDVVVVEEPSFFCALQSFSSAGARLIGVPIDKDGMRVDLLEPILERYKPKLIYTMPTFQNPSGAVMSIERRHRLLELAYRHGVPILEDDPYSDIRFEGETIPSLKALDQYGYVMYLSTFSKILFPGLRVGWLTAPKRVINMFTMIKQMEDLHTNSLSQYLIDEFLRNGFLEEHLKKVCKENARRRDIIQRELKENAVPEMEWNEPKGGSFIWCRLPKNISTAKFLSKASEHKVAFVPGDAFFTVGQQDKYMRLAFSHLSEKEIKLGVRKLMTALRESQVKISPKEIINIKPIV